jgi:hypothetical protein
MRNAIQDPSRQHDAPPVHGLLAQGGSGILWHDNGVLHACEGLLLTESVRTSVIVTACGRTVPDDAVSPRDSDPAVTCPSCLGKLADAW